MDDHELTWKEFKDFVDAELSRQGISEDRPIRYIDISFLYGTGSITVVDDENCGIAI